MHTVLSVYISGKDVCFYFVDHCIARRKRLRLISMKDFSVMYSLCIFVFRASLPVWLAVRLHILLRLLQSVSLYFLLTV
jgi:hypothetical protein